MRAVLKNKDVHIHERNQIGRSAVGLRRAIPGGLIGLRVEVVDFATLRILSLLPWRGEPTIGRGRRLTILRLTILRLRLSILLLRRRTALAGFASVAIDIIAHAVAAMAWHRGATHRLSMNRLAMDGLAVDHTTAARIVLAGRGAVLAWGRATVVASGDGVAHWSLRHLVGGTLVFLADNVDEDAARDEETDTQDEQDHTHGGFLPLGEAEVHGAFGELHGLDVWIF